ncbi:MAG: 3',5'-cyclic-nucleotide phosphodiesterase [Myxococcales bacterium 68-20]|nr:3',5'-cyclic-nucleotide phosphodiesterase [Myxococcales bacterium]OJY24212.1 MAG: 3',5'-cyclic-nucleotide phosphodiesterase [Myxococcales bacterium 68-20]
MQLRVVGCHGGETPKHRTCAFVLDERLAIDAGSLTSGLDLPLQCKLEAVLVSHAHLDHVRDLATIADNRAQIGCPPLLVVGTKPTLDVLRKHFFNDLLWPDFTAIPSKKEPTIVYKTLRPEVRAEVAGFGVRAIAVSHTIDTSAFIVDKNGASVAYSGDTGPTDRLWEVLNAQKDLRALLMEVSFPNEAQRLATLSGHHTPQTLVKDLAKYARPKDLPTLLYHIKPAFQREVEKQCSKLKGVELSVLALGDQLLL